MEYLLNDEDFKTRQYFIDFMINLKIENIVYIGIEKIENNIYFKIGEHLIEYYTYGLLIENDDIEVWFSETGIFSSDIEFKLNCFETIFRKDKLHITISISRFKDKFDENIILTKNEIESKYKKMLKIDMRKNKINKIFS